MFRSAGTLSSSVSGDAGVTWSQRRLLPENESPISYALATSNNHAVFVYTADVQDSEGFVTGYERLMAASPGGQRNPVVVGARAWPHRLSLPPSLLVDGGNLVVVILINDDPTSTRGVYRLLLSRSSDQGLTWSPFEEIDSEFRGPEELKPVQTKTGTYILVIDNAQLRLLCLAKDGRRVTELSHAFGSRSDRQFAQAIAGDGLDGSAHITWVDTRHAKGDLLTPFSDQPFWINNDAFSASLSPNQSDSRLRLLRWTSGGGYVRTICTKQLGDSIVAVWADRARVNRSETEYGEKYQINYSVASPP